MILLEGVDRTGKTTVATELMKLLPGWSFQHQTKPDCHPYKYGMQRIAHAHPRIVLDRLHWSNYCYGHTYDGSQDLLSRHEWRLTELALASRATMVIYMHDSVEGILGRWGKDEMYPPTEIPQLLNHYTELLRGEGKQQPVLPTCVLTLPELVVNGQPTYRLQQLAAECEYLAQRAAWLPPPSQGIGTITPKFVIVADAPPEICEPCGDVPRFPLDNALELWTALDNAKIKWWEGYYTYSNVFFNPSHFTATMNTMNPNLVIALGDKARDLVSGGRYVGLNHSIQCRTAYEFVLAEQILEALADFSYEEPTCV